MYQKNPPQLYCFYLDHTFYNAFEIGQIYSNSLKNISNENQREFALLSTCQRIEFYTISENNSLSHLNLPFAMITGRESIENRLINITSGVFSQILGERNIFYQVKEVRDNLDDGNPFKHIFSYALERGTYYRDKYSFQASKEYEDLAIDLLKRDDFTYDKPSEDALVIIGSGMLAQGLLEKNQMNNFFNQVYVVTRCTKHLKKRTKHITNKKIYNITNFLENMPESYKCILATKNLSEDYINQILPVLTSSNCKGLFELSASPIFESSNRIGRRYSNMYKGDYLNEIEINNKYQALTAYTIRNEIENAVYKDVV